MSSKKPAKPAGGGAPSPPAKGGAGGAAGRGKGSPARAGVDVELNRSPGGSRTMDVTVTATHDEAARLAAWKAQMAAGGDSDGDVGFDDDGDGAADSGAQSPDAILRKYGLKPEGGEEFKGQFDWNGFGQVEQVTAVNQQLMTQLEEREREVERLHQLLEAVEPIPGLDPNRLLDIMKDGEMVDQDPRDIKIINLAKKVRAINLQLQKEKTKVNMLDAELEKYKEIAESKVYPQKLRSAGPAAPDSDAAKQSEQLEQQVKALSSRLNEYRVKATSFEEQLKKTRAALQKEVGTNVQLDQVIEEGSNWRGRAQKIVMMKARIQELEERLAEHETRRTVDIRAKQDLQEMERERQRAVEAVMTDFQKVQEEAVEWKRKHEAAKARVSVLENDSKKARENIKKLLAKTSTDDELIDALRQEVQQLRREHSSLSGALSDTRRDLDRSTGSKGARVIDPEEFDRLLRQNQDRARQLEAQEKMLASLKGELRVARSAAAAATAQAEQRGGTGMPPPSSARRASRPTSAEVRSSAGAQVQLEAAQANIRMLQMDNLKQQEVIDLLRQRLGETETRSETYVSQISELQKQCRSYEGELGIQRTGVHGRLERKPSSDAVTSLKAELQTVKEENEALRQTYRANLARRDEEIALLKDQMSRMNRAFMTASTARQDSKPAAGGGGGGGGGGDVAQSTLDRLAELEHDNDILRRELTDVRAKYHQLNVRQRASAPSPR